MKTIILKKDQFLWSRGWDTYRYSRMQNLTNVVCRHLNIKEWEIDSIKEFKTSVHVKVLFN